MFGRNNLILIPTFLVLLFSSMQSLAQCAMCKAVLESNMQSGEEAVGAGINEGIMYIMFVPYLLIGIGIYLIYKHQKKTKNLKIN